MTVFPLIFDINGFSLDDGQGIRTTAFFKGCPLSCVWCHNPESWSPGVELAFYPDLCVDCGVCISVCPEGAVRRGPYNRIDRKVCTSCGACATVCPSTALRTVGRYYPPDALFRQLLKNRPFYEASEGGVTFSGGEPTQHMPYLSSVMRLLKSEGIHVALQTSGMFDPEQVASELLPLVDVIYFDLKIMDAGLHKKFTGVSNDLILSNFCWLAAVSHDKVIPRTPLVPGITATEKNLKALFSFVRDLGYERLELLSYNHSGATKRQRLGMPLSDGLPETVMTNEEEMRLRRLCGLQE